MDTLTVRQAQSCYIEYSFWTTSHVCSLFPAEANSTLLYSSLATLAGSEFENQPSVDTEAAETPANTELPPLGPLLPSQVIW